jgi:hypothetical protein
MRLLVDEYTDCTKGERRPTLVHRSQAGETLLLLADADDTGFSIRYQPLMDVVKASFTESLSHGHGSLQARMRNAIGAIHKVMQKRFVSSPKFGEEHYYATFVALGLEHWSAFPMWIGSPQAKLVRDGVCFRTTNPQVTAMPNSKFIVTNKTMTASSDSYDSVVAGHTWSLVTKDVLILADHRLFVLFSDRDLASIIERESGNKAKALVESAQALDFQFAQSAIVAQVL